MKKHFYFILITAAVFSYNGFSQNSIIANHTIAKFSLLPDEWIDSAKANLHIAYGHTSHGSQLITGMEGLVNWKVAQYAFNEGGLNGALDIDDYAFPGASDLGNPDRTSWAAATRNYLNDPANNDVNVVIWSWCGQVSSATEADINTYLNLMNGLENDYQNVNFVYMTGHLDGTGTNGNLNIRNEQIRNYCVTNGKILYDFSDIESYDPDGNYYLDKDANDNCDYDSDGNGSLDKNWAIDWQNSHTINVDWYDCSAAHSQPLNGNLKAYAAWWLWAKLAGWDSASGIDNPDEPLLVNYYLFQNFPNPFNPNTSISFKLMRRNYITLKIYNQLGSEIEVLANLLLPEGYYEYSFNSKNYSSGVYFYRLQVGNEFSDSKKMILLK
ncbi:MAG: T9SS type A sorting domain-containing protein [Ignavibacteriaceae bacterium]|nr:T9SS type A sorting domain-containing protein [Ignavibacteriaceae bacterium]